MRMLMRYLKGHGQQTRGRIVEEASHGLRQAGFDSMSVYGKVKLVFVSLRVATILTAAVGQYAQKLDIMLFEERQHPD